MLISAGGKFHILVDLPQHQTKTAFVALSCFSVQQKQLQHTYSLQISAGVRACCATNVATEKLTFTAATAEPTEKANYGVGHG